MPNALGIRNNIANISAAIFVNAFLPMRITFRIADGDYSWI
jgi:hypothetical protein